VVPVGGTDDGRLGTDADAIEKAIATADQGDGVVLVADLGSSVLTARSLIADLDQDPEAARVMLADAPFVEGAVAAAVAAGTGLDLAAVVAAATEARHVSKF
jgi:PTS hybrid protein